jgi:hypothetical protein
MQKRHRIIRLFRTRRRRRKRRNPCASCERNSYLDDGRQLNQTQLNTVRGYEELEEDLLLEPSERKRGLFNFYEKHEADDEGGYDDADDNDDDGGDVGNSDEETDDHQDDESNVEVGEDPPDSFLLEAEPAAKSKKGKSKPTEPVKAKQRGRPKKVPSASGFVSAALDCATDKSAIDSNHGEKDKKKKGLTVPANEKKSKQSRKAELAAEETEFVFDDDVDADVLSASDMELLGAWKTGVENKNIEGVESQLCKVTSEATKSPVKFRSSTEVKELLLATKALFDDIKADSASIDALRKILEEPGLSKERTEALDGDAAAKNESQDDDDDAAGGTLQTAKSEDDDDKSVGYALEEALSSHDEADDEFIEQKPAKKTKVLGKVTKPKKAKPAKKTQTVKTKVEKPSSTKQLTAKNDEAKKKEEEAFRLCEERYWDLLRRWKSAIDGKSHDQLQELKQRMQ